MAFAFGFTIGQFSSTAWGQVGGNRSNTKQIDPLRAGDNVEVRFLGKWVPGVVESFADGRARVEYQRTSVKSTRDFNLEDVRFPNGEGQWALWRDRAGKLRVEARYIARDETHVMIRKADGSEMNILIDDLAIDLRQKVKRTPVSGDENKIDGAVPVRINDRIQVRRYSDWHEGRVTKILIREVEVEYQRSGRNETDVFSFNDIRYPNGEGFWREWRDASGNFKIIARYLSRTDKDVTILKEDGGEVTVPIQSMSTEIRRILSQTPVTGKENLVDGVSPIRVSDKVQVKDGSSWYDGLVTEVRPGKAMVKYTRYENRDPEKKEFELKDIRFPNGEGHWRKWSAASGASEIIARFAGRNSTHVTLIKEGGARIKVPIDQLSSDIQRQLESAITLTPQPDLIEFELKPKTTSFLSSAPNFSGMMLADVQPSEVQPMPDGGFGFELTHGDKVSAAIATGGSDGWVAVGTYGSRDLARDKEPLTRLYWTKPSIGKVVSGPCFSANERIVDFSAAQNRLITVQVTPGYREQPEKFCSYRVQPGIGYATPEAAWAVAEQKSSYGRGSAYMARLVGDDQLLLGDGGAVSLYDFRSRKVTYTLSGVSDSRFVLHPGKQYFAVRKSDGGVTLHRTENGFQVGQEPEGRTIGFSQDGMQVLAATQSTIKIWPIDATGPPTTLMSRNLPTTGQLSMLNDRWIFANNSIYSIQKEMVIWRYQNSIAVGHNELEQGKLMVAGTGTRYNHPSMALVGIATVPHESAIEKMQAVDPNSMIMLKRGARVQVDAQGDSKVRAGMMRVVNENGWIEDPNSEIRFVGSAKRGKPETVKYGMRSIRSGFPSFPSRFGRPEEIESVTASPWIQHVAIEFRGRIAWQYRIGGLPHSFTLRDGESVQSKVNAATQPTWSMFENLKVAAEMFYPEFKDGFGTTSITTSGFVDRIHELRPIQ